MLAVGNRVFFVNDRGIVETEAMGTIVENNCEGAIPIDPHNLKHNNLRWVEWDDDPFADLCEIDNLIAAW
mgnify:CR=1 FL=1